MNIICNETENLKKVEIYYNEIVKIKKNLIDYFTKYNESTKEYLKNLKNLQKNYSNNLKKNEINNKCDMSELYKLTKLIPSLIKEKIGAFSLLTDLLTKSINEVNNTFEENDRILKNIESDYIDSKKDLENKNKLMEKLKNNFFSKAQETENLLIKYQKEKKCSKLKNNNKDMNEKIEESLKEMKRAEEEYINVLPNIQNLEDSFISSIESFKNTKKTILCSNVNLLKESIQNFIINYKNCFKMIFVEQDEELREMTELKLGEEIEKLIEKNKLINKPFRKFKIEPYKMKLLDTHKEQHFSCDLYKDLTSNEIDDNDIFEIANKIYENLSLKNPKYNIEIEKDKIITNNISNKILAFSNQNISLEKPTKEEINKINKLMDSKYNREIFIQKLNEFRNHGVFIIPNENYIIIGEIINSILNRIMNDSDYYSAKNCIILSQTFYKKKDEQKIFLQEEIKNNPLFKNKLFWDNFILYSIQVGITESISSNLNYDNNYINGDIKQYNNIVFAQLIPLADNMIEFGLDKEVIKELINPKIEYYKLSEESKKIIMDILEPKK